MKRTIGGFGVAVALGLTFGIGSPSASHASLVCTNGASGGDCTETVSLSPTAPDFTNVPLTLNQYDGTDPLTSLTIVVGGAFSSNGLVNNANPAADESYSISFNEAFTFSAGPGAPGGLGLPITSTGTATGGILADEIAPGGFLPYEASITLSSVTDGPITTDLSSFTGDGTFELLVSTLTSETISGGGGYISIEPYNNTATPTITITYDYSDPAVTPIPATLPLFASGLGAMAFFGWRRKRKAAQPGSNSF